MNDEKFSTSDLGDRERIVLLEKHFLVLETQVNRIVSDIQSEKATRNRSNVALTKAIEAIDKRVRVLEKSIWIGFGLLAAVQFFLTK